MADITSDEIQQKINALPPEVKSLLYSTEMNSKLQLIGAKNQLHIDQIGALESEVAAAMIGISPLQELAENISDTLEIDRTRSDAIVKDINEQLLDKVRNSMKQADAPVIPVVTPSAPPAVSVPTFTEVKSEGKSVVMPSSVAKTVGAEMAHGAPAVVPVQNLPVVPPVATPAPVVIPTQSTPVTTPAEAAMMPTIIKPSGVPSIPKVDAMLSEPTVSIAPKPATPADTTPTPAAIPATAADAAKVEPPKPGPVYKTDPYHEPID